MSNSNPTITVIAPGALVWVPAPKNHPDIFSLAVVLAVDENCATVRTEDKEKRLDTIDLLTATPFLANPTVEADMTGLHHIHEPAILYNLEQRSIQNFPYSFMGSVLVAVNPLKKIENPTNVGTRSVLTGPPHPYAVAESSFQQMAFQGLRELMAIEKGQPGSLRKASQSIVIGGESGAGKTESSKMVLQHLVTRQAKVSSGSLNGLDDRLLGTNPILEAFGNATTLRNPNSSRFGKMLRLHFQPPLTSQGSDDQWTLRGATVQSYLLERSRVTTHEEGERGYHIMYYVIAGAAKKAHPSLGGLDLENAGLYRYTSPLHPKMQADWDIKFVAELIEAMKAVGLTDEDMQGTFQVVAALIHMGNIEFSEKDTNDGATSYIADQKTLNICANLLGVQPDSLSKIFCERRFEVVGKEMMTVRNARAAGFARDAVAKAVYSGLFDWIMRRIDVALGGAGANPDMTSTIGVLDIFGFETFQINGFEQLLINYTNEALQGTFNSQIFIAEAALYQKEGLLGSDTNLGEPLDNGICIELLQGNPNGKGMESGLLLTIDSEGRVPDPSDAKMNQRLHANFGKHVCMVQPHPKDKAQVFIIKHYAATVTYTIGTFLEKNNDRLPDDMESTLKASSRTILREVFDIQEKASQDKSSATSKAAAPPAGKKAPPARKPPAKSIVHKFQGQIKQLVDDLESTKCSFIRCVKPNAQMVRNDADPSWFNRQYVKKQLDALNIAQTAEVLRNGFPSRIEYSVLVDTYVSVLPAEALKSWNKSEVAGGGKDNKSFVRALFYAFDIDNQIYKLGLTKVFFKGGKLAELDAIMKTAGSGSIPTEIIKKFTYYYARSKWRRAAILSLCQQRMIELCQRAMNRTKASTKLQSVLRMSTQKTKYRELKRGALTAQKMFRGRVGRKLFKSRAAEFLEAAKKRAEEARARGEREAIERAEREEKAQREALLRRERDAQIAAQEQAAKVAAALENQQAEMEQEQAAFKNNRRMSMMPRRTSVLPAAEGGGIAIKMISKQKGKRVAPPPLPPPPPEMDDDDIPPPPPPPEDDLPSKNDKKKANKRNSFFEKLASQQEEDFKRPAIGHLFFRIERSRKSLSAMSRLLKSVSKQYKWEKYFFVMNKVDRKLTIYTEKDMKVKIKEISILKTNKLVKFMEDKQKPHAAQITDASDPSIMDTIAFESESGWKKFAKDFDDTVIGFRTTVPSEKQKTVVKAADLKVVAQLNLLLFRKQITQKEFEELMSRAQNAAEEAQAEKSAEEEKLKEEMKLPPLKNIMVEGINFGNGKLSCGNSTLIRKIDHVSFEEVYMLAMDFRFHLDEYPDKGVGWQVAHKFNEFQSLHKVLAEPEGPLTSDARLQFPEFPTLNYGSYAKRINREHNEGLAKLVEAWIKKVWALVPLGTRKDTFAEDLDAIDEEEFIDPSKNPANWKAVRDPESGEVYWHNKVTGETTHDDPFEGIAKSGKQISNLPEGWEEILDPDTNEVYYYNNITEETSWESPVKHIQEVKKYSLNELLHVEAVNNFFDLKGNVEALVAAMIEAPPAEDE